ncbi:MAG: PAS domain S-box protein [Nitrospirae bacterium]|nr:MAG: PAS domain S-box protein [Nitrospirota bacterium]
MALSTIPAAWVGREPSAIAAGLADVLAGSLYLDFAFVRLCDPKGGAPIEMTRGNAWKAFPEWLQRHLAVVGQLSRREIVPDLGGAEPIRGIVIPIGINAEGGLVAVASNRTDFPTEIDQLLLSVAANRAATAFQSARLEQELRQARTELEIKVAERTAELRRAATYLAEAQRLSHTGSLGWSVSSGEIFWSEETYHIFEYDRTAQPTLELVLQRVHPDDRALVQQIINRASNEETHFDIEHRLLMPDGAVKYLHVLANALQDSPGHLEFVGAVTDITPIKQAGEALRLSEEQWRDVFENNPTMYFMVDSAGTVLSVNPFGAGQLGYTVNELVGHSVLNVFYEADREAAQRNVGICLEQLGRSMNWELRKVRKDGTMLWVRETARAVHRANGPIVLVACEDITERKRTEAKLEQAFQEIQVLKDQLYKENLALKEEIDRSSMFEEIVGASPVLQDMLARIAKVAPTGSTVLITGETGTGKELIARAIHKRSQRSSRAFVNVNCAATPPSLIASELFGHEKGAFTGALQRRLGRFELAEGGTIFLDEIGELPAETQIALLRVLQEREFERVGGTHTIRADVRVIAATNRDLNAAIEAGTFRRDLYYRLNVFPIESPPLRERQDDILLLVEYFIDRYASKAGKKIRSVNKKTLELLQSYPWPGNIRELQNVIERSVILCETETFSIDESWLSQKTPPTGPAGQPLSDQLVTQEKAMIEAALAEARGRVSGPSGAAAKLGLPPSTLESKIRSLKISKHRFKPI